VLKLNLKKRSFVAVRLKRASELAFWLVFEQDRPENRFMYGSPWRVLSFDVAIPWVYLNQQSFFF